MQSVAGAHCKDIQIRVDQALDCVSYEKRSVHCLLKGMRSGGIYSQSSSRQRFVQKTLTYTRRPTSNAATAKHTPVTARAIVFWFGGFWKFGVTPAGGVNAGPFIMASSCAGVIPLEPMVSS